MTREIHQPGNHASQRVAEHIYDYAINIGFVNRSGQLILDNQAALPHIKRWLMFGLWRCSLDMMSQKPERMFGPEGQTAPPDQSSDLRGTYDERLNHILRVATALIAQVGYEKASMRAVAKAAGVSLAGLYHYFDSKEKMLFLIQFRAFSSLVSGLREKLHGVTDPVEQLRVMVRAHVGYFAANMAALKVCSHELDSLNGAAYEEALRLRREYYELTRNIVDRIFETRATGGTLDRHVATMSLFGMLNWLYRWYNPKQGRSPTGVANQLAEQFLHGTLGAATTN